MSPRDFDEGTNHYYGSFPAIGTGLTLATWIRLDAVVPAQRMVLNVGDGQMQNGCGIGFQAGQATIRGLSHLITWLGGFNLTVGTTWYHYALTKNGADWKTYNNGVLASTNNAGMNANAGWFYVGGTRTDGTVGCKLAHAAIWADTLTEAEILALVKGAPPTKVRPVSLMRYLPLWGPPTEFDYSKGTPLTYVGSATVDLAYTPPQARIR